ncbi:alkaline phosphatase D [Saccharopolyspora erythraea NRRL 2338]|uniref:Phosphodiesterase/alkaline phosphatase D n=2 Tax=Saccharopolyspora erythraea TaxID=1836 RepID=A4F5T1_SACEN|nr:alkaline phosphatase D family protein [Saccharopolyspora erythraea]EQD83482.1 alkaline phosphatase [Saccharopolyspora erythraea D]PFG93205.1 alkaline phosphatase D [Saccharopolyspora erythraea NRRL 2338]QRK90064.1 alkaline phosphatase D family protein [Saccharopolyspora erythraea]CAL99405.1 phosphodiesterase/alkaline phosphatase D [Saccharopolyspora erythraea NRRL 2338]
MRANRRDLLRGAVAAGALGAAWPLSVRLSPAQAHAAARELGATWDEPPFTLGVASGDPLPDGVSLWTRLAPQPLADSQPLPDTVEVEWVVATDPELSNRVASGTAPARAEFGHSVHVDVGGLEPGRRYFYRFAARGRSSRLGRTRTAPVGPLERVRFAAANCQAFHDGFYAAHRGIAAEDVDFVVHLGDYIYEHGQVGGEHVRDHEGPEAFTLTDYRRRHALYKGDPSLRAAHAAHPWFLTWDDHEVVNDYSGTEPSKPFRERRAAAYQAWFEHMPVRSANAQAPRVHQQRHWGDLLELTILDLRQYRSAQNLPNGTILGREQKDWLKQRVDAAPDSWHCWVNSIMLSQLAQPGGGYYFTDQWDGFLAERREVLTHVHDSGMPDLVVVTGDWHSAFVDDVRPDFDDPDSPVIGTEFTAHSVSSSAYDAEWNRTNGPVMGGANPHLKYFEGDRYGYDVHEVTPRRWSTHMRVVADRDDPRSPVSTLTTFHVDRGRPGSYEDPATIHSPAQYRRA